jgi:hypothetical protein
VSRGYVKGFTSEEKITNSLPSCRLMTNGGVASRHYSSNKLFDFKYSLSYDYAMKIKIDKPSDLIPYIEHTNLKPEATPNDIIKLPAEV